MCVCVWVSVCVCVWHLLLVDSAVEASKCVWACVCVCVWVCVCACDILGCMIAQVSGSVGV